MARRRARINKEPEICTCGCGQPMIELLYRFDEKDYKYYKWDEKNNCFAEPREELDEDGYKQFDDYVMGRDLIRD